MPAAAARCAERRAARCDRGRGCVVTRCDNALQVEKQTRLASDAFATGKVAVAIVSILFECKDWEGLNSNIVLISKRRQQLKQVLVDMTQEVGACAEF